ncbi:hypothetical protein [Staphylococcus equorum]|uniref:hypothetical protein n=1 Tax=Staphylococcus equorum TaxID=246432 RepID=UPI0013005E91|nr:hypothetical protein [Staphylococcus equorum]
MNKSFSIAIAMLVASSIFFGLLANDGIRGLGIGFMISLITYVFFEYEFFSIKKD